MLCAIKIAATYNKLNVETVCIPAQVNYRSISTAQLLNVDLSHVESRVAEVLKHDHSLTLLNGELIERWAMFLSVMVGLCYEVVVRCHTHMINRGAVRN